MLPVKVDSYVALISCIALLFIPTISTAAFCEISPDSTFSLDRSILVDPDNFNDTFSGVFSVRVTWDTTAVNPPMEIDSLIALSELIMPDSTASWVPDSSIAHRLAKYIGKDEDGSYEGIHFKWKYANWNEDHDNFIIKLDHERVNSAASLDANLVTLGLKIPTAYEDILENSVWRVACDLFGHEWGHMCNYSQNPWDNPFEEDDCKNWASGISPLEFAAQAGEFLAGKHFEYPIENPTYHLGFGRDNWREECYEPSWHEKDRRWIFSPFAGYMFEHYHLTKSGEQADLLHQWFSDGYCSEYGSLKFDFESLGAFLFTDFKSELPDTTSAGAMMRDFYHRYALAAWVNHSSIDGDYSVLLPESGGSMRDFNYFSGGADDCALDGVAKPYYFEVSTDTIIETGPIYADDVTDPCTVSNPDKTYYRRELFFETYSFDVLPFQPDLTSNEQKICQTLRVDITLEGSCGCEESGSPGDTLAWIPDNEVLKFSVLGYGVGHDSLDTAGQHAELLEQRTVTEPDANEVISFSVPCFGSYYASVVILASQTENSITEGRIDSQVVPYKVTYWSEPSDTLAITADIELPESGSALCINNMVSVGSGIEVTISPGTDVFVEDPDFSSSDELGFEVSGDLFIGDLSEDGVSIQSISNEHWDGILVKSGGDLVIANTDIEYLLTITAESGSDLVDIRSCEILVWDDEDADGFRLSNADSVRISDTEIYDVPYVTLSDAKMNDTKLWASVYGIACVKIDGDADLDDIVIYDAYKGVEVEGGDVTINNLSAEYDPGSGSSMSSKVGLYAEGTSDVSAKDCTFDGFAIGVIVADSARVILRQASIEGATHGVYVYPGTAVIAELGNNLGQPGDPGNNCIDGSIYRVNNRSSNTVLANHNYWDIYPPTSSLFSGSVSYSNYMSGCYPGAGGPGFSFGFAGIDMTIPYMKSPYPNPFNPTCQIEFYLPTSGELANVDIFDVSGRRVITLFSGECMGQTKTVEWSGESSTGSQVSSGIYFARLQTPSYTKNVKLVLLK